MNDNDKRNLCTGCGLMPQKPVRPKPPVCGCKKKKCCKKDCCENDFVFRKVVIPAALGDDETGKDKPVNGAYTNSYVEYEANGAQYMYDSYGVYTKISQGEEGTLDFNELINRPKYAGVEMTGDTNIPNLSPKITALQGAVQDEKEARIAADSGLQTQIDALAASSDVTDIVGTYAELEAYDTQHLKDNDIIKVLQDETHDDETTYYRWSTSTETFTLIGEEGPYYTKAAADQKFQDKLTAGDGVTIDSDNVISADGETIFYANLSETGSTRRIYKDINFTTAASAQDIIDANDKGQVILRGTSLVNPTAYSDSYLQNAFIMPHNNDYEFVFLDRDLRYEYTVSATTDTAFYYDTSEIQPKLTAGTNVQITGTTISATDTTYSNFTGTDGVDPGTAGLVPAPATTDAGKYLKADGTWDSIVIPQSGIPTTATFFNQTYDSVNNRVASNSINIGVPGDSSNLRELIFAPTGGTSTSVAYIRGYSTGRLTITSGGGQNIQFSVGNYARMNLSSSSLTGQHPNGAVFRIKDITDPIAAQDVATKNYTDNLVISYASLNGAGAPTTSTAAQYVGQLYLDTTNDDMYYCSAITAQGTTPETYEYTWEAIGGSSVTLYADTGTNTDGAMTQLAASQMIYPSGSETNKKKIAIGAYASAGSGSICISANASSSSNASKATGTESIAIGNKALAIGSYSIAIGTNNGYGVVASGDESIAIGSRNATANKKGSIVLGSYSTVTRDYELSLGTGTAGSEAAYASHYISHVKDPQNVTDAANKRYVDNRVLTNAGAPTTSTVGTVGQVLEDTTNGKLYICTDATNPYVWEEVGSGGGGGTTETYTIADTDWTALSASSPYDYSATVTATYTIGANTIAELINDQAVLFGNYGFAIGDITGQTVTIYSIGAPSASVTLKINYKG